MGSVYATTTPRKNGKAEYYGRFDGEFGGQQSRMGG
jgi:hypothetical protein